MNENSTILFLMKFNLATMVAVVGCGKNLTW